MFVSCISGVYRIHSNNNFVEGLGSLGVPVKRELTDLESLYSTMSETFRI